VLECGAPTHLVSMTERWRRHPTVAALLSFLFPGLGQAYLGRRRLAAILAAPVVILILGVLLLLTVFSSDNRNLFLSGSFLVAVLLVDMALMAWRLLAIAEAAFGQRPEPAGRWRRAAGIGLVVVLLATTVGTHAWAGLVINRLDAALGDVFSGGQGSGAGGGSEVGPGRTERPPINQPDYHWDGTQRITFLLLGVDAGPGRGESLTDTILAVSIDPVAKTAVMVSVPRDTGYLPLPDRSVYSDALYPQKINQLATDAGLAPEAWCPDLPADRGPECGIRTLERAISLYLGIPIEYYAQVDLQGFADLIDAVGGLTLCLPGRMVDPQYSGPTWPTHGIELPAGCTHYDGVHALAYARIRKGWIEMPDGSVEYQNDFKRADRQQKVLLALRSEFANANLIFELPRILDAVGSTVLTDFPRSKAGDLASLLPVITGPGIDRMVLGYPDYVDAPTDPELNYLLIPRRDDVRAGMQQLLGPGTALQGWYLGSHADGPPDSSAAGG